MAENSLCTRLRDVLINLAKNPFPEVPNPPDLKKRASVAVVIRISPQYDHWPPDQTSSGDDFNETTKTDFERIANYFDQGWTIAGEPEVLFIKRASREGDRWTGHVAFPGGGREQQDSGDLAAAVRETWEEVGLDLTKYAISAGNLPQRLVTMGWGKLPLMVLCPYVFLLEQHKTPPLRLQPTEVASIHWVPLRCLLAPELRTFEYQDVSSRMAGQKQGFKRTFFRLLTGLMMFAALRLAPSETIHVAPPEALSPKVRQPAFSVAWARSLHGGQRKQIPRRITTAFTPMGTIFGRHG